MAAAMESPLLNHVDLGRTPRKVNGLRRLSLSTRIATVAGVGLAALFPAVLCTEDSTRLWMGDATRVSRYFGSGAALIEPRLRRKLEKFETMQICMD